MVRDRKVAAHEIELDGKIMPMQVVSIREGRVSDIYPLDGEMAGTEWLGGRIEIRKDSDSSLIAYKDNKRIE